MYILVKSSFQRYFSINSVLTPYKFCICDTTDERFGSYQGGGIATQVKVPVFLQFVSFKCFISFRFSFVWICFIYRSFMANIIICLALYVYVSFLDYDQYYYLSSFEYLFHLNIYGHFLLI